MIGIMRVSLRFLFVDKYARLLNIIINEFEIDSEIFGVEIAHRNPLIVYERTQFVTVPIWNDVPVCFGRGQRCYAHFLLSLPFEQLFLLFYNHFRIILPPTLM